MLLALAISIGAAGAAPLPGAEVVFVPRSTWLHHEAREDGPRVRVREVDQAPAYRPPPVVALERLGTLRGWVRVRTLAHAPAITERGGLSQFGPPDEVPYDWPLCYPQPAGLAQLGANFWVRQGDLLPVLTREVDLTHPDGTLVHLEPGLALTGGRAGVYRVLGHHVEVVAPLPEDAVGTVLSWPDRPPVRRDLVAERGDASVRIQPTWQARVDLRDDTTRIRAVSEAGTPPALAVRDRCLEVRPPAPWRGIPERDVSSLRGLSTTPIEVPVGTVLTRADGEVVGDVTGGPFVLWTRIGCAFDEAAGMCCDPLVGLEGADGGAAICFEADLPVELLTGKPRDFFTDHTDKIAERAAAVADLELEVGWTDLAVKGPVIPQAVVDALEAERENLGRCYLRALRRDPSLSIAVPLRFGIAPDGRGRAPSFQGDEQVRDAALRDCIDRRIRLLLVPDQVGRTASIIDVTLTLAARRREG